MSNASAIARVLGPTSERLRRRSVPVYSTGCVEWVGGVTRDGYGSIAVSGKSRLAHCVAFELAGGIVPPGLELDHSCRNRRCINAEHLEPVTHAENMRRAAVFQRASRLDASPFHRPPAAHCRHGHAYDNANTYRPPSGGRQCRACNRAAKVTYLGRVANA